MRNAEANRDGSFALPVLATRYILAAGGEVEVEKRKDLVAVSGDKFSATFSAVSADDAPGGLGDAVAEIPALFVKRALKCALGGHFPGALGNICLRGWYAASTDGHRLYIAELDEFQAEDVMFMADAAKHALAGGGDVVEVRKSDEGEVLVCGDRIVWSQHLEGRFPPFEKMAKEPDCATAVSVDKQALAGAVSRVSVASPWVRIEVDDRKVRVSGGTKGVGVVSEELDATAAIGNRKCRARFQAKYIKPLMQMAGDEVMIRLTGKESASYWILGQEDKVILMPCAWTDSEYDDE